MYTARLTAERVQMLITASTTAGKSDAETASYKRCRNLEHCQGLFPRQVVLTHAATLAVTLA